MSGINTISGSALQAFGTSQQVTANNVANLNTDNFKASRVTFQEQGNGGVTATAASTTDSVDISREAVNLLTNVQGFKANLAVLKTADEMSKQLLSIKA
ncbi:MAG: flagellar basal body protein [Pelobacteraceae bacterium]